MINDAPGQAAAPEGNQLSPEAVLDWLRRNPDFLSDNPEVLATLAPPQRRFGDGVVDMQKFMLDRLQTRFSVLQRREQQIMSAADDNADRQARILQAALGLVAAADIDALAGFLRSNLPEKLDLEAAAFCVEDGPGPRWPAGTRVLAAKRIRYLMGTRQQVVLKPAYKAKPDVFGDASARIGSVAYVRLRPDAAGRRMMVALGSGSADGFTKDQSTDLLCFLADILDIRLEQCRGDRS